MLDAVIIVLREALEAALIVSILLALNQLFNLRRYWCIVALACGALCSWVLAKYTNDIAELFDGAGQELLSAALLTTMVLGLVGVSGFVIKQLVSQSKKNLSTQVVGDQLVVKQSYLLYFLLILVVICATAREGSEVWIYLTSFAMQGSNAHPVLLGAAIGAGIGICMGAIFYYACLFMEQTRFAVVSVIILTLVAGGLGFQIAQEFMQIGWLESGQPLWNSSALIPERSLLGELLYALVGYEATPTLTQLYFYLASVLPFIVMWIAYFFLQSERHR
jgi:high-affinity iron transporter